MKIGGFAKKYKIPISTVRYYIEEGLITPKKSGAQYDFDEFNEIEMQILTDLRESAFSLEEMRQFVNISRIFDEKDPARYKELNALFTGKKERLSQQIDDITATIQTIDAKLSTLTAKASVLTTAAKPFADPKQKAGLSLASLQYLACPECGKAFDMDNVKLSAGRIISGNLNCSCGYEGSIEDGMVCVDADIDLDKDPQFRDDYFIDPAATDHEPIYYECFLSAPQHYLSINHKARTWMHETILSCIEKPAAILFPDIASVFPYLYSNAQYLQGATLIIMGLSKNSIGAIRKHMDTLEQDLNIIYIVTPSNRLPIKRKSIDLMIDYMGSYNYAFFFKKPLYEYIDPYFSDTASVAGCLAYYKPNSRSISNIINDYEHAMNPFLSLSSYINVLTKHNYTIVADKMIGSNTILSEYFHYHERGECHYLHTLLATRLGDDQ